MELTDNERNAYEAVAEIQDIKRAGGQMPDYAILHEVYNQLRPELPAGFESAILRALRTLYRRGLIEYHRTVNGTPMFGIINPKTKQHSNDKPIQSDRYMRITGRPSDDAR